MKNNSFNSVVANVVENIKGCQFVGMSYESAVKLTKAQMASIGGEVTKMVSGQFQINYSYESAVNNRLDKQGSTADFKAESLPWGNNVAHCPL